MKKALSLILALVMIVTCLSGVVFAEVPANAIASVVTGDAEPVYATTLDELLTAIDSTGNSVVTLLKDLEHNATITPAYTFTLDLNGFTWKTTSSNAIDVQAAGSETKILTVKNGTVDGAMSAIAWRAGALVVDNATLIGRGSVAIQILCHTDYEDSGDYNDVNIIKNSTLYSSKWHVLSFNSTGKDFSGVSLKVETSDLIAHEANQIFANQGGAIKPGTVVLGKGVNMYSTGANWLKPAAPKPTATGETVIKAEGTFAVAIDGQNLTGRTKWYTEPLATVQTGDKIVRVATLADMVAAIDKKGESVVTLYEDIEATATQNIPVCTLDLNGHTWTTKNASGAWQNAIYFNDSNTDADATNLYSVIKNGTVHGKIAVSCNVGALKISNASLCAYNGTAVQLTDSTTATSLAKGLWNDGNVVENSVLYSADYTSLIFNSSGKNFSAVEFTIKDSDMITQGAKSVLLSNQAATGTVAGTFKIGTGMNFYYQAEGGVARTAAPAPTLTGETPVKLSGTYAIEVADTLYEGFTRSTTETKATPTVNTPANGTVTLSPAQAYSGQTVTVVATAAEGYEVDEILVNGQPISGVTFVMPKGGASVEVTFKSISSGSEPAPKILKPTNHTIKIETVTGGTVKASAEKATINTVIDLEIIPEAGYVLESITVKKLYNGKNATVTDNSFYMPYSNVVITPVFKQAG